MTFTEARKEEAQVMNALIQRCWEDESFKNELVSSPVSTLEKFTGKTFEIPEGVSVQVNDQSNPSVMHINIPAQPNLDNMELTDEELEQVAGGDAVTLGLGLLTLFCTAVGAGYYFAHDGDCEETCEE